MHLFICISTRTLLDCTSVHAWTVPTCILGMNAGAIKAWTRV